MAEARGCVKPKKPKYIVKVYRLDGSLVWCGTIVEDDARLSGRPLSEPTTLEIVLPRDEALKEVELHANHQGG